MSNVKISSDERELQQDNKFEVLIYEVEYEDGNKLIKTNDLSVTLKVKECRLPTVWISKEGKKEWDNLVISFNAWVGFNMTKTLFDLIDKDQEVEIKVLMYFADGERCSELLFKNAKVHEVDLGQLSYVKDKIEYRSVDASFRGTGIDINFNK